MSELEPHYVFFKIEDVNGFSKSPDFEHVLKTAKELCEKAPDKYHIYELIGVVELAPKPVQTRFIDRFTTKSQPEDNE